jgi:hypothetical protein
MTEMFRYTNSEDDPLVLYFIVKVFDPAVKPVKISADDALNCGWYVPPLAAPTLSEVASDAATVEAPETAGLAYALAPVVVCTSQHVTITRALVPVVKVTAGPTVARSVKLVLVVLWEVFTVADADSRPTETHAAPSYLSTLSVSARLDICPSTGDGIAVVRAAASANGFTPTTSMRSARVSETPG